MKSIVMLLFMIGLVMVVAGFYKKNLKCPPPKVIIKYVPRTFKEEQENPMKTTDIFSKMFKEPSSWWENRTLD